MHSKHLIVLKCIEHVEYQYAYRFANTCIISEVGTRLKLYKIKVGTGVLIFG